MRHRCYHCGFETDDKADFIGNQGDGDRYWSIFICPQCSLGNPPVAEIPMDYTDRVPWRDPDWKVVETNHGLYVRATPTEKGGHSSSPMIPKHQLWNSPASLLRPDLTGTMADHHKRLIADGNERSAAFREECKGWEDANPRPSYRLGTDSPEWQDWRKRLNAFQDESRRRHRVGPHEDRIVHDGPDLMRRGGLVQRWVRVI